MLLLLSVVHDRPFNSKLLSGKPMANGQLEFMGINIPCLPAVSQAVDFDVCAPANRLGPTRAKVRRHEGASASRSASPIRLIDTTRTMMRMPAGTHIQGLLVSTVIDCAAFMMLPRDGVGA